MRNASTERGRRGRSRAPRLTHLDGAGRARMVDVGGKRETRREAVARGAVVMSPATLALVARGAARKGDVLAVAEVAGIAAAKRTWELVPLCHTIPLTSVAVTLAPNRAASRIEIEARVRTVGRTGAEMEALTAVAVAGLAVYDMVKGVERGARLEAIRLVRKSGGKSGTYVGAEEPRPGPRRARRRR
jgi:cyclic pyranopterin phosphate synthase